MDLLGESNGQSFWEGHYLAELTFEPEADRFTVSLRAVWTAGPGGSGLVNVRVRFVPTEARKKTSESGALANGSESSGPLRIGRLV